MDIRKIDDTISVAPQITYNDVAEIARLGFRTLVANRPDQEEFGQPAMADIEAAARENDMTWVYMPVESGNISDADVDRFSQVIQECDEPVFAFCRSGTRCTVLWALNAARTTPARKIFEKASSAGYDISGLAPRMAQQSGNQ